MVIHKLKATFGCLDGDTLELQPGLNVINAPNESGKSTWCAFIRAMLYGIDSAERAKTGFLPDKTHYAPWSGKPMGGTMELTHGGLDITLTRSTSSARAPMRNFSATYTGTGDAVPGIDAANVGEYLTGASRSVFCSSAFIGQGAAAVTGSAELERRIASVVSSGEEEVSASEADERLRAWLRRRRYNKRGAIPELENDIAAGEAALRRVADTVAERDRVSAELERCTESINRLSDQLKNTQERERTSARQSFERSGEQVSELEWRCSQAERESAKRSAEAADRFFDGMSPDDAAQLARTEQQRAEELRRQSAVRANLNSFYACAALCVLFVILAVAVSPFELIGTAVFAALGAWRYTVYHRAVDSARSAENELRNLLSRYGVSSAEEIPELAADYARRRAAADKAAAALEAARAELARAREARRADESRFTGAQESEELRRLSWELASLNARRESLSSRLAELSGVISALGDPVAIESGIRAKQDKLAELEEQYDAIELAANTLEKAGAELQNRFSPALGHRAAEIFQRLTGGRYEDLTVSRDFSVAVRRSGDSVPRGSLYLSAGAVDLMYLAVRLAIAELALPNDEPCPIILDDALAYLDPTRRERVLDLLDEIGRKRQVILFTCA
ncbi:MAG TPA: AAA family ATPase [Candidatus Scatomorpha merdigallinarum]|nr:AAA family ATPase [Candidatus Scatomorpha merdigallinarum]